MYITMVKKIMEDGSPCRKCVEVEQRLRKQSLLDRINNIVVADERDPESEGIRIAQKYEVKQAPFFIVEEEGKLPVIYTVYFQFIKEVFRDSVSEKQEIDEIMQMNPDIDYI